MAPDMQTKNILSKLTTRQKVMAGLLVVVLLVIFWQLMGLFGGGSNQTITKITPASSTNARTPMSSNQPNSTALAMQQGGEYQVRQAPVQVSNQFITREKETEQQYMSKLNELEALKIQRQIAEMNQAIAVAKLATVTAEKGISDILIKPASTQVSAAEYAAGLTNPVRPGEAIVAPQVQQPAPPTQAQYTVISVTMQLNKWSAVLGYQGKLYDVSVGDVLPIDGSVVEKIFKDGVVLNKDGNKRKISLVSAI